MRYTLRTLFLLIAAMLVLQGCYENVGSTLHEPGQYKGPTDPLLAKLKAAPLQQQLDERFKTGQHDR